MNDDMDWESTARRHAALASPVRLRILHWLLDPRPHFPPQRDGDLVADGVCVGFITDKTGLSQPTVSAHMKKLSEAGLVRGKRIGNWIFYKPERDAIRQIGGLLGAQAGSRPHENRNDQTG
ncbi:MAG: metalloregulator ArsR/SmtB family transcription factor [Pseudomonadota bacterium]